MQETGAAYRAHVKAVRDGHAWGQQKMVRAKRTHFANPRNATITAKVSMNPCAKIGTQRLRRDSR